MIDIFFCISLGIAVVAWSVGYGLLSLWLWMLLPTILGLAWLLGWLRNRGQAASAGLALFTLGNVLGLLYGIPPLLNLISLLAALVAWDLDHFGQRLLNAKGEDAKVEDTKDAKKEEAKNEDAKEANNIGRSLVNNRKLEQNHLLRLLVACIGSLLFGGLALLIHLKLNLGLAILFALLAAFGLNRMIYFLRKETD